jgi:hypothetical protein
VVLLRYSYNSLDILWGKEFWDRHRTFDSADETIGFRLILSQGGEELLHLGWAWLQTGELAVELVGGHRCSVALLFVVGERLL